MSTRKSPSYTTEHQQSSYPSYPPPAVSPSMTHPSPTSPSRYPPPNSYQGQGQGQPQAQGYNVGTETNGQPLGMPVARPYQGEGGRRGDEKPMKGAYTNAYAIPPSANTPSNGGGGVGQDHLHNHYQHHHQQHQGQYNVNHGTASYADPQFSLHPTQATKAQQTEREALDSPISNETTSEQELDKEEEEMLRRGVLDWNAMKSWKFWFKKSYIKWYVGGTILIVLVALMGELDRKPNIQGRSL